MPDTEPLAEGEVSQTIDPVEAQAALEKVVSSSALRSSQRIRQFLRYVVEETLAGRGDGIKAYSIAIDCFDRDGDFDPQLDPYVRIVARRLRRALKRYYEDEGAADAVRIEISRGGYVPAFFRQQAGAGAAAPAAVEGVQDLSATETVNVAVIDIEGHGDDDAREFLASGLTQEIILALSRFDKLVVVGPISVVRHEVRDTSPRDIGRDHDAEFVLMGSVHKLGDRLRMTASLTDVRSSAMVWAERYERDLTVDDLFAVQDDIAGRVAATIADASGVIVRRVAERTRGREPGTLTSYEAVLKGFHWNNVGTVEVIDEARSVLEAAVVTDPEYALPHALLSDLYFTDWCAGVDHVGDALDRASELAERAVDIDPFSSDAHWARAQVHFGRRELEEFRNAFDASIELNPNNASHLASYAMFLALVDEWDEARNLFDVASRLNPNLPVWFHLGPGSSTGGMARGSRRWSMRAASGSMALRGGRCFVAWRTDILATTMRPPPVSRKSSTYSRTSPRSDVSSWNGCCGPG